ncbi:TetR/AcrR family transcriptional regulator [Nocardia camponoti]|uniref:Transcriptional regulator, TetR family protein n=1 Tax=Nocardia camponoti TaxID=1616106 RepID=A0A917V3T6_9NOCA|nr:TetR family transcriptional regulator [Nocardia camponoti]GGK33613.1 putative transcriptional regulator, TetR family protein [Nocardia camponoti]
MCSADLTAAARIRDAAITLFGEQGFSVGVRAIATAAGVSPGLVIHHFGSKEGLRAACDAQVLAQIRDEKLRTIRAQGPGMLTAMAEVEDYAPLVAYLLRSFQAGGELAVSMLDHMVDDAVAYTQAAVESGMIKPSRDPRARARYLVLCHVGAMNLFLQLRTSGNEVPDFRAAIRALADEVTFPALELYAQGMFTDPTMLDQLSQE